MIVRPAKHEEVNAIFDLTKKFYDESNWKIEINFEKSINTFHYLIDSEDNVFLVVEDNNEITGFAIWGIENPWTIEKIAIDILFYIAPKKRNFNTANKLLNESIEKCKNLGAKIFYTSSTAGFDDNGKNARAYNMLYKKNGFSEIENSKMLFMECK